MYWKQKRLLSQNSLTNRQLVKQLIRGTSISSRDCVLEIGSGRGLITEELLKIAGQVRAIELDGKLFKSLKDRLGHNSRLELTQGDFLSIPLPIGAYKVFSNIPFNKTGEIIRRLLQANNPPQDVYLVMQNEAASKFIIHPNWNTMAAILYYPWWDIRTVHQFQRADFSPAPKVDSVLLAISAKSLPHVPLRQKGLFYDFVAYHFTHNRLAKFTPPSQWVKLFSDLLAYPDLQKTRNIRGAFTKLEREQKSLQRIHRTRTDKNWRKFS